MTSPFASLLFEILGVGASTPVASATLHYELTAVIGTSTKSGAATSEFFLMSSFAGGDNGEYLPDDRFRIVVQNTRDKQILTRDMVVSNLQVMRQLSGPATIECDVNYLEPSAIGIEFKPWAQYIHASKVMLGKRKIFATGIVQPSTVDPKTGVLHLVAKGFSCYPKGIPWLEDVDWWTNDAFDPVVEIWSYLQGFPDGNLDVQVYPTKSSQMMLPGYSFDGALWNMNFFATFVRATDRLDCGDYIDALAKDIPFDYVEESEWSPDYTDVYKRIHLGYSRLGRLQQGPTAPVFVINENVIAATPATEAEIDWVSDVGITGWFPGMEYSFELANADPDRLRRYLDEENAFIDSNERAEAWAHRKLARRQTPKYWSQISVIPDHPNAPLGSYDVGDTITVSGFMPWHGNVTQTHKIMAITVSEKDNLVQLDLKADYAFYYQPIYYLGDSTNIIDNSGFDHDLSGWTFDDPARWSWDGLQGVTALGSATVTADGATHYMISDPFGITDFQRINATAFVKCLNAVSADDVDGVGPVRLELQFYDDTLTPVTNPDGSTAPPSLVDYLHKPTGTVPWTKLEGYVMAPVGATHVALLITITPAITNGQIWLDDVELPL